MSLTRDRTFMCRGHEIRYGVMGPEGAPAIALLHGTPFSAHEWRRIAPWLARHFRVHFHDMLGYGASAKGDLPDVSLGIQNEVFAALLDHWGLERPHVIAHDFGGATALRTHFLNGRDYASLTLLDHWGLERPHVIAHDFGGATALRTHFLNGRDYASLTLIDPVAIRPWGSPFVAHVRHHEAAFAGMPAYMHEALLDAYLRSAIARPIAAEELAPYKTPWLGEAGQIAFYRQIAHMDLKYTDEVEPRYGELRCPAQVLWGAEDQWIPIETGRRFHAMLPECRFMEVPGAGHLVQEDAPEAILSAVADFPPLAAAIHG